MPYGTDTITLVYIMYKYSETLHFEGSDNFTVMRLSFLRGKIASS